MVHGELRMNFRFDGYQITDDAIIMQFSRIDSGREGYGYQVTLTDAELAGVSTAPQLRTLVLAKLKRKVQADGIATKLDSFIGQVLTL